ncbi:MAG: hypothetical protein J5476_03970 [Lachnospiraceae bacterium]|nr:hypothetical protein [Lachnospiraceae bacterium]
MSDLTVFIIIHTIKMPAPRTMVPITPHTTFLAFFRFFLLRITAGTIRIIDARINTVIVHIILE